MYSSLRIHLGVNAFLYVATITAARNTNDAELSMAEMRSDGPVLANMTYDKFWTLILSGSMNRT